MRLVHLVSALGKAAAGDAEIGRAIAGTAELSLSDVLSGDAERRAVAVATVVRILPDSVAVHAGRGSMSGDVVHDVAAAVRDDVRRLARARFGDHDPVSPEFFGPLWPDGAPDGWPSDGSPARAITAEELTRRQVVAIAARAAGRLQPLFWWAWPEAPAEALAMIDHARAATERYVAGDESNPRSAHEAALSAESVATDLAVAHPVAAAVARAVGALATVAGEANAYPTADEGRRGAAYHLAAGLAEVAEAINGASALARHGHAPTRPGVSDPATATARDAFIIIVRRDVETLSARSGGSSYPDRQVPT